jgi:hypothetical protein
MSSKKKERKQKTQPATVVQTVAPVAVVQPVAPATVVQTVAPVAPVAPVAVVQTVEPVAPVAPVAVVQTVEPVAPVASVAVVQTVEPVAPVASVAVVQTVAPVAPVEVEHSVEQKHRTNISFVLGTDISHARCRSLLKKELCNEVINNKLKELRTQLESSSGDELKFLNERIDELSSKQFRISSETPIVVSLILDQMLKELIVFGMDKSIENENKIVETMHVHFEHAKQLKYFQLYNMCDSWKNYDQLTENKLKMEKSAQNKAVKAAKKQQDVIIPDLSIEESTSPFYTYVDAALKTIKKQEQYSQMRVSNRLREYLSTLVCECVYNFARISKMLVHDVMNIKTVNADHMKSVIKFLLMNGTDTLVHIEYVTQYIDERLKVYHDFIDSEKDKKYQLLDDDKKLELEQKKKSADIQRKTKQRV